MRIPKRSILKQKTEPPQYGFKVKLNHEYLEKRTPYFKPSLRIIWDLLPLCLRYVWYYLMQKITGKPIVMDYIIMRTAERKYGVPIGGIGSGTIGRGFKGEFCRFQLRPNACEYNTVDANQFIVTIKDKNQETIFQSCLSTYKKTALSAWQCLLNPSKCSYIGLYPRAWTQYDLSKYGVLLTCRQISPVIPHNYESSCLPCAVFVWSVENVCGDDRTVTISFTFKNGTGSRVDKKSACSSKAFSYKSTEGVVLYHTLDKLQCSYTLAAKSVANVNVTKCLNFNPNSTGSTVWNQLLKNGQFDKQLQKNPHIFGEVGVAIAAQINVSSKNTQDIEMILVWDIPSIIYPAPQTKYYRYYTDKFGREDAALKIVDFAFENYEKWEEDIYQWQRPVLEDGWLPDWYKSALFNELYFISDGGSVWLSMKEHEVLEKNSSDPRNKYGRFAYLEGHEYRMYNSYDVHFYASHALNKNWPILQRCIQYDLRDFVFAEVDLKMWMLYNGEIVERKKPNSVPHDAGTPKESPFSLINSYPIHDVSNWRDLGSKFVLQTFRDAWVEGKMDAPFIKDMYKCCDAVMQRELVYDYDDNGLIQNCGEPDQTYDTWVMVGASAYCGGLWLAAVYAMTKMAKCLGLTKDQEFYQKIFDKGVKTFNSKLWNGKYYSFDCSNDQSASIMSDQLNAQWYLGCIGEGKNYPIFPQPNVDSALRIIYKNNVLSFCEGKMGAVNGFLNGQVDKVTVQSQEVWVGVTYALAATMIQEGMFEEGFKTAGGMFKSMTERFGLIFDTPEALYEEKCYRSLGYMRPLSIWSMQLAWEATKETRKNSR
ncbi:non-lysosomal glucosylceramidase [Euwallacea similis]|uniref:non-lysosomal glucosylceramidase n=1 Tax=Euwallacea similis TaxID=1736056 RepID=UPI00345022DA